MSSRGIDDRVNSSSGGGGSGGGSVSRKLDSPELHPLPPLIRQNFTQNNGNAEMGSNEDEEEEQFYSSKGSLGSRESSSYARLASGRVFMAT